MSTNGKSAPHVLILGAGLSGLLLAQALMRQGISFDIYERDEGLQARFQGYAIGISGKVPSGHPGTMILTRNRIIDDILGCVPEGLPPIDTVSHLYLLTLRPQLNFFSGDKKFVGEATDDPKVLFANRSRLRSWLATGLDIKWNKRAIRIEDKDNLVTVVFEDGSSASGDMVVGADGISSMGESQINSITTR
jgi:flavin-dependent dehydrogenase